MPRQRWTAALKVRGCPVLALLAVAAGDVAGTALRCATLGLMAVLPRTGCCRAPGRCPRCCSTGCAASCPRDGKL